MNDTSSIGYPGILAFAAFFFLAIALWLLMRNMNARLRRMTYTQRKEERQATPAVERADPGPAVPDLRRDLNPAPPAEEAGDGPSGRARDGE